MYKFWGFWFRWSTVSSFMRLRIAQAASSIPLIGYLLLWSEQVQTLLHTHPLLRSDAFFSTITRLTLIYVGSIFLGIAWLIYLSFCPRHIARHPIEEEFHAERLQLDDPLERETMRFYSRTLVVEKGHEFTSRAPRAVTETLRAGEISSAAYSGGAINFVYRAYYRGHETVHGVALGVCLLCIAIGVILFLAPSLETSILVFRKFVLFRR